MKRLLIGLAILSSLVVAVPAQAAIGTVDMMWDGCAGGPVDKTTNAAGSYDIFVTVTGHDEAHVAYDVRVWYGNASQQVPDAWRFDADGCQGSAAIVQDVDVPVICTPFSQRDPGALQVKKVRFSPPEYIFAPTLMMVAVANTYAAAETVNHATRYLLERIRFDLGDAVPGAGSLPATCGGFEQPMCFKLWHATWLDTAGNEKPFHLPGQLSVSFNGPSSCSALPVQAKTWGSIKSQYRD